MSTYVERTVEASELKELTRHLKSVGIKLVKSRNLPDGKIAITFAVPKEIGFNGNSNVKQKAVTNE
jgi:hypothetical protein